jgi:hypothetical protein
MNNIRYLINDETGHCFAEVKIDDLVKMIKSFKKHTNTSTKHAKNYMLGMIAKTGKDLGAKVVELKFVA